MPRTARQRSASNIYHVTARGAGRRTMFEDDEDKARFVRKLDNARREHRVDLFAWCLMDNHYHLLLRGELDDISRLMRRINTSLAHHYNGRHGHVGPVVQGRFSSTPVESNEHFLGAVRYIHLNPRDREDDFRDYPWSSYRQYAGDEGICDTEFALDVFGGRAQFETYHEIGSDAIEILDGTPHRPHVSDAEAKAIASKAFGASFGDAIAAMGKAERNRALSRLHGMGISIRQLERLTGIGRGVIQPAVKKP